MAVTSIWPITGNPNGVIEYAINPEKTSADSREETAALHAIDQVMEYTADDLKTEKRMYVSGVNCQIPHAKEQFMETKRRFGKLDGRTCYHGYQSFRAGEVDADTAHRIGVELADPPPNCSTSGFGGMRLSLRGPRVILGRKDLRLPLGRTAGSPAQKEGNPPAERSSVPSREPSTEAGVMHSSCQGA